MKHKHIIAISAISAVMLAGVCGCSSHRENYTVIVSLDAFRWDYPDMFDTPWLDSIARSGVRAVMKPSFPSSTFPNHYTIATGLVPDHTGIVNSQFWDSEDQVMYSMGDIATRNNPKYYGGEPIWVTAERQGVKTASLYWVGSDIPIKGVLPSIYRYWYDEPRLDYLERAHEAVRLLSLPKEERPRLLLVYFDDPDATSHEFGAISMEAGVMVHYLDSLVGVMYKGIRDLPYGDKVNIIVTADHGMTDISEDRFYAIDDYLKPEWCEHVVSSNPTSIFTAPGCRDSVLVALSGLDHVKAYRKEDVPAHLDYGTSPYLGDVIVIPAPGWQFDYKVRTYSACHGYDIDFPDMQVNFAACGPDFKKGFKMEEKFRNVCVYPLLAHLLGINPAGVDGSLEEVKPLLAR